MSNVLADVVRELDEAEAELARHHRDFEAIRDVLDSGLSPEAKLRAIRNVVG